MNEEEKFDELLRSKLSEREFPMDDLNWDEAEKLINKQERWGKISRISLVFSAGLALGIGVMLPLILKTHNVLPDKGTSGLFNSQNLVSSNNITITTNKLPKSIPGNVQSEVKIPQTVQPAFVKKNNSSGVEITHHNSYPIEKKLKVNTSILTKTKTDSTLIRQQVYPELIASAENIEKSLLNRESNSGKVSGNNGDAINLNYPPVVNNNIAKNTASSKNSNKEDKKKTINNSITANNKSTDNGNTNKTRHIKISSKENTSYVKPKTDSTSSESPPLLPGTQARNPNEGINANILSVYAGANYSFGWNNGNSKEANGITPWAGFAFAHCFNNKIAASIGIGYSQLDNLNKTYTSNILQYDFGATVHIITVTPQSVYYLAIPINFQYNFDSKDKLTLGFDYLIMLTTYSTLTTYQQTYFGETLLGSETENGYTQGFSNNDLQFAISYSRMFTKRFGVSIEGYMGFISVENSTFPGNTQSEKNKGARLVLSYQLIK